MALDKKLKVPILEPQWVVKLVQQSLYVLQIVKYQWPDCCRAFVTNSGHVFLDSFLPTPTVY